MKKIVIFLGLFLLFSGLEAECPGCQKTVLAVLVLKECGVKSGHLLLPGGGKYRLNTGTGDLISGEDIKDKLVKGGEAGGPADSIIFIDKIRTRGQGWYFCADDEIRTVQVKDISMLIYVGAGIDIGEGTIPTLPRVKADKVGKLKTVRESMVNASPSFGMLSLSEKGNRILDGYDELMNYIVFHGIYVFNEKGPVINARMLSKRMIEAGLLPDFFIKVKEKCDRTLYWIKTTEAYLEKNDKSSMVKYINDSPVVTGVKEKALLLLEAGKEKKEKIKDVFEALDVESYCGYLDLGPVLKECAEKDPDIAVYTYSLD